MNRYIIGIVCGLFIIANCEEKKAKSWKSKNIMDMTDADMERLLDQWEVRIYLAFFWNFGNLLFYVNNKKKIFYLFRKVTILWRPMNYLSIFVLLKRWIYPR